MFTNTEPATVPNCGQLGLNEQERSLPRPLTCTLPPGTRDKQPQIPEPALLERAPCPWHGAGPPIQLCWLWNRRSLLCLLGALGSPVSASGDLDGASFFPCSLSSFLSFVSTGTCSLSGLRLGICLKHTYNGSGAPSLFLVMTDKPGPPKGVGGRGVRRKSNRL